jgi:hypothetical protein
MACFCYFKKSQFFCLVTDNLVLSYQHLLFDGQPRFLVGYQKHKASANMTNRGCPSKKHVIFERDFVFDSEKTKIDIYVYIYIYIYNMII